MAQSRRRFGPLFYGTAGVALLVVAILPFGPTITEWWHLRGLARQWRDPTPGARQAAIEGLYSAGPAALPWVLAALRDDDPSIRSDAVLIVSRLDPDHQAVVLDALIGALGDPNPAVRSSVAIQLQLSAGIFMAKARPETIAKVIRALLEATGDDVREVRVNAALAVGWFGEPARAAIPDLERLVATGPDVATRLAAARALLQLAPIGSPAAARCVVVLRGLLTDPALIAARQGPTLVQLLRGHIGDAATAAALIPLLDRPGRRESFFLITLLDPQTPGIEPALVEALRNSDPTVRTDAAMYLLGHHRGPIDRAVAAVLDQLIYLRDGGYFPWDLVRQLRQLAPAELPPIAERLTAALDDPDLAPQRDNVIRALKAVGPPEARPALPTLRSLAAGPDRSVALRAIEALATLDPDAAASFVPQLIAWSRPGGPIEERQDALARLGDLGASGKEAIPSLSRLADEPEIRISAAAIEAITRIDPDRGSGLKQVTRDEK